MDVELGNVFTRASGIEGYEHHTFFLFKSVKITYKNDVYVFNEGDVWSLPKKSIPSKVELKGFEINLDKNRTIQEMYFVYVNLYTMDELKANVYKIHEIMMQIKIDQTNGRKTRAYQLLGKQHPVWERDLIREEKGNEFHNDCDFEYLIGRIRKAKKLTIVSALKENTKQMLDGDFKFQRFCFTKDQFIYLISEKDGHMMKIPTSRFAKDKVNRNPRAKRFKHREYHSDNNADDDNMSDHENDEDSEDSQNIVSLRRKSRVSYNECSSNEESKQELSEIEEESEAIEVMSRSKRKARKKSANSDMSISDESEPKRGRKKYKEDNGKHLLYHLHLQSSIY